MVSLTSSDRQVTFVQNWRNPPSVGEDLSRTLPSSLTLGLDCGNFSRFSGVKERSARGYWIGDGVLRLLISREGDGRGSWWPIGDGVLPLSSDPLCWRRTCSWRPIGDSWAGATDPLTSLSSALFTSISMGSSPCSWRASGVGGRMALLLVFFVFLLVLLLVFFDVFFMG